jgi:hypothetical protein
VSFSNHARRVRDASLPFGKRVSSLRSCVERYQPLGWHATLSFLEEVAGPYQHDEDALLRALDVLSRSRSSRSVAQQEYAERRQREKRGGRRNPREDDPDPTTSRRWFGDHARAAALHALRRASGPAGRRRTGRASSAPDDHGLTALVDACLAAGGALSPEQRRQVTEIVAGLHVRLSPPAYDTDPDDYRAALTTRRIAGLLMTAADSAPGWSR